VLGRLGLKRFVTLTGLGGIGKSELARAVAHAARGREWAAEGVLYVDLQSATSASLAQERLCTKLKIQPAADAAALAQQLGGHRLYVLDDLHQALVKDRRGYSGAGPRPP
jgi:predicted ATPase